MFPRRVVFTLLVTLAARPAAAGEILYVSASTPGRIDGYCLADNGSPAFAPAVRIDARRGQDPGGAQPRRLVVDTRMRQGEETSVLYVAEVVRVEAYRIGRRGGLTWIGQTRVDSEMRPLDASVSADGTLLYVPQTGRNRVVAYPLDGQGTFAQPGDFTSCVQETAGSAVQLILVNGSLLYVTAATGPGRVDVFQLNPDGSLPLPPESIEENRCQTLDDDQKNPEPMWTSTRRGLSSPKAMVFKDGVLYVVQRNRATISAFELTDGNFAPPEKNPDSKKACTPTGVDESGQQTDVVYAGCKYQKKLSGTASNVIYENLVIAKETILGTVFGKGRVDSFLIRSDGKMGKQQVSNADVRLSPVRATAHDGVLYVSAGAFDRVVAFQLRDNGQLSNVKPFARTSDQNGSFPNDVAVAVLSESCD